MPRPPTLSIKIPANGHRIETDLLTLGPMVAYYRVRAGLTRSELAIQALTMSSQTVAAIEQGAQGIATRNLALRMADALRLTPHEADHFLHVAGFATVIDWQQFARDILGDLGLDQVYEQDSIKLYDRLREPQLKAARVPPRRRADDA